MFFYETHCRLNSRVDMGFVTDTNQYYSYYLVTQERVFEQPAQSRCRRMEP